MRVQAMPGQLVHLHVTISWHKGIHMVSATTTRLPHFLMCCPVCMLSAAGAILRYKELAF
jgi:hypothetical protein